MAREEKLSVQDTESLHAKYHALVDYLVSLDRVMVAFSGGVDSTFLLAASQNALGDNVIAVTARSCSFPERELQEARAFCKHRGIEHIICDSEELEIEDFRTNPPNRCYLCKRELFEKIGEIAAEKGMAAVVEGSNMDDLGDYRPGLEAVAELGIESPLRTTTFHKAEIRAMSRELGLPTWDKQSFACLASRFPYGETISEQGLKRVDHAEQFLLDQGFHQVRVRTHGDVARIEILPEEFPKIMEDPLRTQIYTRYREIGFAFVSLDLQGYRTGSMNATLPPN